MVVLWESFVRPFIRQQTAYYVLITKTIIFFKDRPFRPDTTTSVALALKNVSRFSLLFRLDIVRLTRCTLDCSKSVFSLQTRLLQ